MDIETWPIASLRSDERNARKHGKRNLATIRESLAQFGQRRAAVIRSDGTVLAGNGMMSAALDLGWTELAVTVVPDEWSDEQARAYALADNRSGELAEWDSGLLGDHLSDLQVAGWDVAALGFDEPEPIVADDEVPPVDETPTRSALGDVWLLGNHRLVVGDSTDIDTVMKATQGQVDAVWTDPPYGVDVQERDLTQAVLRGRRKDGKGVMNDDLDPDALSELLVAAFSNMAVVLRPGGPFYVCSPSGQLETLFRIALHESGLGLRQGLIWVKDAFVLGRSDYHGKHEPIFYGWRDGKIPNPLPVLLPVDPGVKQNGLPEADSLFLPDHESMLYGWAKGAAHHFEGGRKQSSVWQYDRPRSSKDHPTMKPVPLVARAVVNSCPRGGLVFDPFAGAGSTMAACEQTGRRSASIELDPRYADVIIRRWESLSGGVAVRADG